MASITNPAYKAVIIDSAGTKYGFEKVQESLDISQPEKEIAQKVVLEVPNITINGKKLKDLISVKNRAYVYYDIGSGWVEKFRGYVWTRQFQESDDKSFRVVCYDRAIYLQNSKDSFYFVKGKKTKAILDSICKKWGITLVFNYSQITHPKLAIRSQAISDTIIEILDEVKKQTGKKYVVFFDKDVMYVNTVGTNSTIYSVKQRENAMKISVEETMDGMVTKVVIRGSQDNNGKTPVVATVNGDTSNYGTLQDEISKDKDTSVSNAKKEANEILKEKGKPFRSRSVTAIDNPLIKKGDKVNVQTESMSGDFIVISVDHDAMSKTMDLEVE